MLPKRIVHIMFPHRQHYLFICVCASSQLANASSYKNEALMAKLMDSHKSPSRQLHACAFTLCGAPFSVCVCCNARYVLEPSANSNRSKTSSSSISSSFRSNTFHSTQAQPETTACSTERRRGGNIIHGVPSSTSSLCILYICYILGTHAYTCTQEMGFSV